MNTGDFADLAATETDPDRLWNAATAWLEGLGFDRVLHLSIEGPGAVSARTTLGAAFEDHYRDRRLDRHDPFLSYCLNDPRPVSTGVDHIADYPYLSGAEKEVIHAASETGFRAGFSCVVRCDPHGREGWNVGSSLRRAEVEAIRRERGLEIRLGLAALRGRLATPPDAILAMLTARERACLDLLSDGLRTKAIARELGVAAVTVELHLRNARIKLGATTRDQALVLYRMMAAAGSGQTPGT